MPDLQFDESRRRFLRNTAILTLLGCGVRPLLQKPSPVEPPAFIEPRRELIPLERELIEELKRLALDIKDPQSRRYAINFVNGFIRNGRLLTEPREIAALGMYGTTASHVPLEDKIYLNYLELRSRHPHPVLVQDLMVHEGRHLEGNPIDKKLHDIQKAFDYLVKRTGKGIGRGGLINPDGTWKKFPDTNLYLYQLILLTVYPKVHTEARSFAAEYDFYRSIFGDIKEYVKNYRPDKDMDHLENVIGLYADLGMVERIGPWTLGKEHSKGSVPLTISWNDYIEYMLKKYLNFLLENFYADAIRPDGSIDERMVRRNYLTKAVEKSRDELFLLQLEMILQIEEKRGTIRRSSDREYTILDEARFLDWLDTGIYVDENGDAIDLMKLDFTPDTHGVLPKLIPPFVIGITRESVNDIISRGGEIVKKIYPDLAGRIKDICPDWRPINIEDLCSIMTTGRLPLDWPELVSAMRLDGIIDEGDFSTITAIGTAVEEAAQGTALTVNDKALITEVIAIRYLLENAGELRDRLNSLGYGSKADRIILLLQGIKKNKPRHRTDYDFIKGLEKLTGNKLDDSGLNLADIRGNGENHLTRHWVNIFELNLKQWGVLELFNKRKPKGIIVQDIRDLGPGVQNWLEGIKRHNVDMSGVKMAYVTDGISDADRDKVAAVKPANVILVQNIEELRGQGENIVYLASRERLEPYVEQGLRLVERGNSGPVIELSWCLLMLSADDIRDAYKQFMDKLLDSGLITKEQIQELEDPFYIRLPNAEKVLEMWDELQEGSSYLDIWA